MQKTFIKRLSTTIAVAIGIVTLPLAAAHASVADCQSGKVCLFADADYKGRVVQEAPRTGQDRILQLTAYDFNDKTSSWMNKSSVHAAWYEDIAPRQGGKHCMARGSSQARMNWLSENDHASSVTIFPAGKAC